MKSPKIGRCNVRLVATSVVPAGVLVLSAVFGMWACGVRINMTRSLPLGLYRITADPSAELVAFCPPQGAMDESASRGYRGHSYGLGCPDGAPRF